ncbi:Zinc finger CCHC domain-containing protein 12 [Bienertia sinuspersici]
MTESLFCRGGQNRGSLVEGVKSILGSWRLAFKGGGLAVGSKANFRGVTEMKKVKKKSSSWRLITVNSFSGDQGLKAMGLEDNPLVGIKWCSMKIMEDVRANFEVPIKTIVEHCPNRFGVIVPLPTMYKARDQVVREIQGPYFEAYLWQAADAYNEWLFTKAMDKMKALDAEAYQYLVNIDLNLWVRQTACDTWGPEEITPYAVEQIRKRCEEARACQLYVSGRGHYKVVEGNETFPIHLVNIHLAIYEATYELNIKSMTDPSQWPSAETPQINPLEVKGIVGRPLRNRRRELGEQRKGKRSVTVKCSKCGELGHNKRACMGGLTANQRKAVGVSKTNKRGIEEGISTQPAVDVLCPNMKKGRKKKRAI